MAVGQLEAALFAAFPKCDAEPWDNPGLAVGDPNATVGRVAVNLDLTVSAVAAAAQAGCNVLVTHHPAFIKDGPYTFRPLEDASASGPGRLIFEAARLGVACIAMHTNADRSLAVRREYARLLGWDCVSSFEYLEDSNRDPQGSGFGAVFEFTQPLQLSQAAARCKDAFGGSPRIWGDASSQLTKLALLNGSWSDAQIYDICVSHGIDCIVVGETRYHFCLDAQPHLKIIDLGHDRSELPIANVLRDAVVDAGVAPDAICELGCSKANWWTI